MLSDRVKRLLTAAVDGELDQVERRALQKVLQQSEDARKLYRQLKRDSDLLRELPRQSLPPHFSCNVLQAVGASTRVTPSTFGNSPKRFSLPLWANLAAAAAVMIAVCAGTYLVMVLNDQEKAAAVANGANQKLSPEMIAAPAPDAPAPPSLAKDDTTPDSVPLPDALPTKPVDTAVAAKPAESKVVEPNSGDVLTIPFIPKLEMFATVSITDVPPVFSLRDVDDAKAKAFHDSLSRHDALHVDLFCRDTTKAFDRLQNVIKARGQKLTVDAVAQERFNRKLKTHYLFYTESLTSDEAEKLFQALAAEDKKAEARKDTAFDKLVVKALSGDSQKTLSQLLGVDPKWFQPKKSAAAIDPNKLIDSTADKLAQVNGKTRVAGPGEQSVLVLSFNPIRPNPSSSKEVKQFLEQRRDRRPATVPVLIILRTPEV